MNSSSFKGANSIHTLGRGSLSKINAKFPYASPTKQGGSGDNSSGITTEITTKEEDSIAQHFHQASMAISSMSNIKIGDNEDGASKSKKGIISNEPNNDNEEDNSPSKMGFSAKLKMFGSMQQQNQKRDNEFISNDLFDSKRSATKPLSDLPQSMKSTSDQVSANVNGTSPATKTTSPRLSSPVGAKKRMASFLKSRKSIESASSPPSSHYHAVEDGNGSQDIEDNTPSCEEDNANTKGQEKQEDTPKSLSKTVPSFLKSKSSTKQVGASAAAAVPDSSNSTPVNENSAVSSSQSSTTERQPPIDKMKTQGMKKIASIKQQIKQSSPQRQPKPKQPKPAPSSPTKQSTQPISNSRNRQPKKNPISTTQSRNKSNKKPTSNMIKAKSRQRLVLEQVASQYFLSERNQQRSNKYVGVVDYGCDGDVKGSGSSSTMGNIIDETSKTDVDENVDREAVVEFLEGHIQTGDEDDDDFEIEGEDAKNLSIITEASLSSCCSRTSASDNRSRTSGDAGSYESQISRETNIDRILEMASDHLSLGKNDLALLAYRRAMKVAFSDVIRVKQKLVEVKKRQQEGNLDKATAELTRKEEQQFELSLLEVASRVADVHNNMGVVHEMNRQYGKAKSSYEDALEVYHNTCKRFEEKGDPDVDRTSANVERMTLACNSESERRALHDKALRIAKNVGQERKLAKRQSMLNEAISVLKQALELEGETIGLSHPVAAGTLISMGKYQYELREYDSAVFEIRQAITILRNALGGLHPQVGKSTLLLASIYERHGVDISPVGTNKDDSELELYVDALEPLKARLGEVHPEIGCLYSKIGYLYGKKGDSNLALLAYKASLKAYGEPFSTVVSSGVNKEVVSIWACVSEHLLGLKLHEEAVVASNRTLFLLRLSKSTLFQDAQITSSNNSVSSSGGAASTSKKSQSQMTITSDTYYESLFTTLQTLAQAHTSLQNYSLARDACAESLDLAWEMALSTSSSSNDNFSILRIVRGLKRMGKATLLEKHYAPALECFLPALQLLRSSKELESTLDCASVLGSLGFLHLKLRKFTESSNFLRECLRLYEMNGVDGNDRETRKIQSWLELSTSREDELHTPPHFLEIPTIVFDESR